MHTRNWVAFEIGVAAASIPQKPVYVFNEEGVDFAVPYLNHYFPHPLSSRRDFEIADYISDVRAPTAKKDFLPQIIRDPQLVYRDKMCKCPNCMTVFSYWGDRMAFKCPCCGELMIKVSPKYVRWRGAYQQLILDFCSLLCYWICLIQQLSFPFASKLNPCTLRMSWISTQSFLSSQLFCLTLIQSFSFRIVTLWILMPRPFTTGLTSSSFAWIAACLVRDSTLFSQYPG